MAMTMTGTTTISITEKASISRPRSASAIGPLGLRTTARSHAPASRDAPTAIAQRCDLVKASFTPPPVPFIEDRDESEAPYRDGQRFFLPISALRKRLRGARA